jgi:hypothetical protein
MCERSLECWSDGVNLRERAAWQGISYATARRWRAGGMLRAAAYQVGRLMMVIGDPAPPVRPGFAGFRVLTAWDDVSVRSQLPQARGNLTVASLRGGLASAGSGVQARPECRGPLPRWRHGAVSAL